MERGNLARVEMQPRRLPGRTETNHEACHVKIAKCGHGRNAKQKPP